MFFLPRAEINVLVIRTHIFSEKSGPGEANSTKMYIYNSIKSVSAPFSTF